MNKQEAIAELKAFDGHQIIDASKAKEIADAFGIDISKIIFNPEKMRQSIIARGKGGYFDERIGDCVSVLSLSETIFWGQASADSQKYEPYCMGMGSRHRELCEHIQA